MLYRTTLSIALLVAAIVVYFFLVGLSDGSVSSFNIGMWIGLLAAIAVILGGGLVLRRRGRTVAASLVLAILALPALLYALFILFVIVSGERWN